MSETDVPTSPVDEAIKIFPDRAEKAPEGNISEYSYTNKLPFTSIASGAKSLMNSVSFWGSRGLEAKNSSSDTTPLNSSNEQQRTSVPNSLSPDSPTKLEPPSPTTIKDSHCSDPLLYVKSMETSRPISLSSQPTLPQGAGSEHNPTIRPEDIPQEEMEFVKTRAKNKNFRDFDKLFLSQNLMINGADPSSPKGSSSDKPCAIWAFRFSRDGEYLAAGGQDGLIRVWGLRLLSEEETTPFSGKEGGFIDNFPVFSNRPIRTYVGHQSDVLDLSWSKSGFLLSSSTDKTVRLWHVGRGECLCCYQHVDFVTSVAFHPKNDRYFLSGSLDCRIRLWNIPEKKVASWAEIPDSNLVTAVGFSPDGRLAIAGSYHGLCLLYKTEGLELHTQITVKSNSKTRNVVPRKITGIETLADPNGGEGKLLVTSNDSRIRIYSLKDFSLEQKFKGPENNSNQIKATYSDDQRFVVCGSENRQIYLFDLQHIRPDPLMKRSFINFKKKGEEPGCEIIEAHSHIVTVACLAPTKTKATLARLGDPLISPNGAQEPAVNIQDNHIVVSADYFGNLKVFRRSTFRSGATPSIRSVAYDDTSSLNGDSRSSIHSSIHSSIRSSPPPPNTKTCNSCGVAGRLTCYLARPTDDHLEKERPAPPHRGKSHNGSHSSLIKRIALELNLSENSVDHSPRPHSGTPLGSPAPEPCELLLVICLACSKVVSGL